MANTNNQVKYLNFTKEQHPNVLAVANELATLEQRKPHDSIRLLILEAGGAKIERLKANSSVNNGNLNVPVNDSQEKNL